MQYELMNLSDKILIRIFQRFNDVDLLTAARVCKRFKERAKEIVKSKYSGDSHDKYYELYVHKQDVSDVHQLNREILQEFDQQITALNLYIKSEEIELNRLFEVLHWRFIKHVIIRSLESYREYPITNIIQAMPNLTSLVLEVSCEDFVWADHHYPQLESLCLKSVENIDVDVLEQFWSKNPQLKHLRVIDCNRITSEEIEYYLKNHFNGLKSFEISLQYDGYTNEYDDCVFKAENLENLKISVINVSLPRLLHGFSKGSKMIQKLEVTIRSSEGYDEIYDHKIHGVVEHSIGLFDKLDSFKVDGLVVPKSLINIFVRSLPNLISLHLGSVDFREITTDDILNMFESGKQLEELTLRSKYYRLNKAVEFNLEFHQKFVKIVQNRGARVKVEIVPPDAKIFITIDKIIKNGEMRYWVGSVDHSNVHLFDLDEQVLEKIYGYLDEKAQRVLYETCTTTKKAMEERIKSQWFTVSNGRTAKDLLIRFGEHIRKLDIDMKTYDHTQMAEAWKLISEKCSDRLTEMQINNVRVQATGEEVVKFPNLSRLNVKSIVASNAHIFPPIDCPKLTQLQFDRGQITLPENVSQLRIPLNSLTSIRLNYFSNEIDELLSHLNDEQCNQLQEFTFEKHPLTYPKDCVRISVKIVNFVMRCNNLVTLNLIGPIYLPRLERLFQSCAKLRCLTLGTSDVTENWKQIVRYIKENCKQIEVIQLFQSSTPTFQQKLIAEVNNSLPNVRLNTIYFDSRAATYKVENNVNTKIKFYEPY